MTVFLMFVYYIFLILNNNNVFTCFLFLNWKIEFVEDAENL